MFSTDFIDKIEEIYEKRRERLPEYFQEIEGKIRFCKTDTQILLRYLYGNMPLSDILNYSFETYLEYATHGVFLWKAGPYKNQISEEMFCQYVVYHRINTEDISPCRTFFYEQVKGEIGPNDSMRAATIALNYWCAGEVTYRTTDDRTASPMTTYRSSYGRCGEESTFTVSVLRSVGIPARQVYAPRWSHCDDNHAWVEVWCDGDWHFLGACEPEEVLDKGWFLHASSRAMLIHSRWYGSLILAGEEVAERDLISTRGITSELNQIRRYARTKQVGIQVLDSEGMPVQGALVRIEILNYAEFFPVASMTTDENGQVEIDLGLGSCRVWASGGNREDNQIIDVNVSDEVVLQLEKEISKANSLQTTFTSYAPKDEVIHSGYVTEAQRKLQKEKTTRQTVKRLKKTGTGNEKELEKFLERNDNKSYRKLLVETLSKKDLLDVRARVLEEHLQWSIEYTGRYTEDIFVNYIIAPRIHMELLTTYRSEIDSVLTRNQKKQFRENPAKIWDYLEERVEAYPFEEYEELLTLPGPCLKYKCGSTQSQAILFVAICRTLGIPARLNPVNQEAEYYREGKFVTVKAPEELGTLRILKDNSQEFIYYQNWSVIRKYPGERKLLDFSGEEIRAEAGIYEIITANRLPNGNLLGRLVEVEVVPRKSSQVELKLEEASLEQMLECIPIPPIMVRDEGDKELELIEVLKDHSNVVIWLAEGQEPTEHILNELSERAHDFNQGDMQVVFLVNDKMSLQQATLQKTLCLLKNVQVLFDETSERATTLGRRFYVDPESMPLILVTDKEANCIYATSGYNVGTADMILKILKNEHLQEGNNFAILRE
ncbi:hypothetical protein M2145_000970 [Lachnospiraceae bacterium PF1-21]|uniref:transglutaminase-like domain-containing protein n=1 Tax=Ohessyouella blattaphilus TaxID=2949333 RepID=UPI003E23F9AB